MCITNKQLVYLIISPNKETYCIRGIPINTKAKFQKELLTAKKMQEKYPEYIIKYQETTDSMSLELCKKTYEDIVETYRKNRKIIFVDLYDVLK